METVYKLLPVDVQSIPDSRQIKFLISTGSVDRDGDQLNPMGWDLSHYKKSPVVLWSHDYTQPPIAKAIHLEQSDKGLAATAEFPPMGVYPFADQIYTMLKTGFLSATSVGFRPLDFEPMKSGSGRNYRKQELLEFSVVPVPANPEALMQRGVTHAQVKEWKAYVTKHWVEPPQTDWERFIEACNTKFVECEDWKDGEPKAKFLADAKIETEDGKKAMGEARLLKLLTLNGLKAVADQLSGVADEPLFLEIDGDDAFTLEVSEDVVEIKSEDVEQMVREVFEGLVTAAVREAVTQSLNRATGRVS